jgi:RHS repeat-associated protein
MGNRLRFTQGSGADAITKQTPFQFINQSQQPTLVLHSRKVELTGTVSAGTVDILSGGAVGGISQGLGQTGELGGFRTLVQLGSSDGAMLGTTVSSGGTEKQGYLNVPPAEEVLSYDTRGNLIKDARWEYTWDVNNRLVELNEYPVIDGYDSVDWRYPFRKIRLAYDYMGRRIAKSVWVWLYDDNFGWRWRLEKDLRYVYDGWQMIAELDHTFAPPTAGWQPALMWGGNELNPRRAQEGFGGFTGISGVAAERCVVRTYLWGQDLSGTMTGAGGVGGLLSVTHQGVTYHTCSDANGNITGLLAANGADAGQLIARFDYDPFGNRLTNTGPDVEICPMGFSSKYTDSETGLVDYGMRIYSPQMARWLSRDPIGERGGVNLYEMVGNDPVNKWDYLGLFGTGMSPLAGSNAGNPNSPSMSEDAIAYFGSVADGLPRKMLHHWFVGNSRDFKLTENQFHLCVIDVHADLMRSEQFKQDLKKLDSGGHFSGEYWSKTDSAVARTLGNYFLIMKVEVVCDAKHKWSATGTIKGDPKSMRYDYNPLDPPREDELDVTMMRWFQNVTGQGKDYDVYSPVMKFEQLGNVLGGWIKWSTKTAHWE